MAKMIRFANGYVTTPQCVPSRAGALSGIYHKKFGVEQNGDPSNGFICKTIPERLKQQVMFS
jgi:uncharacterized sulfatase